MAHVLRQGAPLAFWLTQACKPHCGCIILRLYSLTLSCSYCMRDRSADCWAVVSMVVCSRQDSTGHSTQEGRKEIGRRRWPLLIGVCLLMSCLSCHLCCAAANAGAQCRCGYMMNLMSKASLPIGLARGKLFRILCCMHGWPCTPLARTW